VDVTQAHIDGCIYTGPASLRFARQLVQWGRKSGAHHLNSISVDQRRWRELGVDPPSANPPVPWAMPTWRWAHSSATPARPTCSTARPRRASRLSGPNPTRWSTPTACWARVP
jgi:hypothetical protein